MELLWLNLVTDVLPSLGLALEPAERFVMSVPPRSADEPLLTVGDLRHSAVESAVIAAAALGAHGYGLARYGPSPQTRTVTFLSLVTTQLLHALACRHDRFVPLGGRALFGNAPLNAAILASAGLQALPFLVPPLRRLLGISLPQPMDLAVAALAGGAAFAANESLLAYRTSGPINAIRVNSARTEASPHERTQTPSVGRLESVMRNFVLTSTSVTDGHPDKLCDRISDAIVDAYLTLDPASLVQAGAPSPRASSFWLSRADLGAWICPALSSAARQETGYSDPDFNPANLTVLSAATPTIGARQGPRLPLAARTWPTASTPPCSAMPAAPYPEICRSPSCSAHRLARRLRRYSPKGELPFLHPDVKLKLACAIAGACQFVKASLFTALRPEGRAVNDLCEASSS
jgi:hypothetical protein